MQAEREASSSTEVGVGVVVVIVMAVAMPVLEAMILQDKFVADSIRMISNTLRHWLRLKERCQLAPEGMGRGWLDILTA